VGSPSPDLSTPSASETSQAIRLLYGHSIAKDLLHSTFSSKNKPQEDEDMEEESGATERESWTAEAHFTNANYQSKKMIFLLFINRPPSFPDGFVFLL
jgi:DNA mismatch repair protein MLH1